MAAGRGPERTLLDVGGRHDLWVFGTALLDCETTPLFSRLAAMLAVSTRTQAPYGGSTGGYPRGT
jgi:hypothetical protein